MNRAQLDMIPNSLLLPGKNRTADLLAWLHARGLRMSLLELGEERHRRGLPSGPGGAIR